MKVLTTSNNINNVQEECNSLLLEVETLQNESSDSESVNKTNQDS